MISALILSNAPAGAPTLAADLDRVGIHVAGATDCENLVQQALRVTADLVIAEEASPAERLFAALASLQSTKPMPVVLFAASIEADGIVRAVEAGVHALVVNGYDSGRLRPIAHLAQARFRHEQQTRRTLADLQARFEERKLVDRAKGILMRATQLPEEEAFRILRNASMRGNRRVGQVSQQVIDAARYAEAVNRAGQLRMLSQRLVKLNILMVTGTDIAGTGALLAQTVARTDANLLRLADTLSEASYGDLLKPIQAAWKSLRRPLPRAPGADRLAALDAHAEILLRLAEQLTTSMEQDGIEAPLHVINVSGRQRMLSQRVAKLALLTPLLPQSGASDAAAAITAATADFELGLGYLVRIPLATVQTARLLDTAREDWSTMLANLPRSHEAAGRMALAAASEALLDTFDGLTAIYEKSMEILTGPR